MVELKGRGRRLGQWSGVMCQSSVECLGFLQSVRFAKFPTKIVPHESLQVHSSLVGVVLVFSFPVCHVISHYL